MCIIQAQDALVLLKLWIEHICSVYKKADRSLRNLRLRCPLRHLLPSRGQGSPLKTQWWTKHLWLPRCPSCRSHFWNHWERKSICLFDHGLFLFANRMNQKQRIKEGVSRWKTVQAIEQNKKYAEYVGFHTAGNHYF